MRVSKALLMRRTSESLRSLEGSERTSDDDEGSGNEGDDQLPSRPTIASPAITASDLLERIVPGRVVDLGSRRGCIAVAAWSEGEWILRATHHRVHLEVVDEARKEFRTYQWFSGQSENDVPTACAFSPPLIPLQPPSSLHECRSLETTGTFAVAWLRNGSTPNQSYVRIYDPVENPISSVNMDWKWEYEAEFNCSVGEIYSVAFAPGSGHLIVGGALGLQLWNLSLGEEVWSILGEKACPGGIAQVQFSSDGRLFASVAPRGKMVRLWWRSESAGHGGFAFTLLPHGDVVKKIEWRPRSASSTYGTAQSLLTQSESGRIRVWQESDPLEDFEFYVVCEITACSPSAFVSWVNYFADYDGLMWPPTASFRRRKGANEEESKKTKTYSSRRVWGAMERGHGHAWFGEAAYDNLESRLGGFPPQSNARDWIVSHDTQYLKVWSVEGLGEHARSAIRCEVWTEHSIEMQDFIVSGLAYCRFLVPASYEGKTMPRCDELFADNPPRNLYICGQAFDSSACGLVQFKLGSSTASPQVLEQQQQEDLQRATDLDYDYVFLDAHRAGQIRFLASNPLTKEVATIDHLRRLIVRGPDLQPKQAFELTFRVRMTAFCPKSATRVLISVDDENERVVAHLSSNSEVVSAPIHPDSVERTKYGRIVGICELDGNIFIVREWAVLHVEGVDERKPARLLKVPATTVSYSADMRFVWIGSADGSLVSFDGIATDGLQSDTEASKARPSSGWFVKKVSCAGTWVVRLLSAYSASSKPIVIIASTASNILDDLEAENSSFRITNLKEDSRESSVQVVDVEICELGGGVCGLAVVFSDGSFRICTRKDTSWQVVASSTSLPSLHSPEGVSWLLRGRIVVFDKSGAAVLYSGWTASTATSWNFSSGLVNGWSTEDPGRARRAMMMKKQSIRQRSSVQLLGDTGDEATAFNDAQGHLTHIFTGTQLAVPDHHPANLLENFRQGRLDRVETVLRHVNKTISEHLIPDRSVQIPPCPSEGNTASSQNPAELNQEELQLKSTAALLFAAPASVTSKPSLQKRESEGDWLAQLESRLPTVKISGISPSDHLALLSCVSLFRRLSDEKVSGLDAAASKFALAVETLKMQNRGTVANDSLRSCEVIWAMHSDAQTNLIKTFLEQPNTVWADCRALGAGFWVQNPQDCKTLMERLAKSHFMQYDRDPFRCLLFYAALNKPKVASALFKSVKNEKVAMLLAQDFTQERWQTAAAKNGYALVEKRRYDDAAGFFLLAGKTNEALRVLSRNLEDFQLALFVGKVVVAMAPPGSDEPSQCLRSFLRESYMEIALAVKDPWLCSMILTLLGEPHDAVKCFAPDYFTTVEAKEDLGTRQKRLERYSWLRQVASRDKPKCTGFDPVVHMFLKHVLARAPFFVTLGISGTKEQQEEFNALISANRRRTALFYISQGLPRLALDFVKEEQNTSELIELKTQAAVSAALPFALSGTVNNYYADLAREAGVDASELEQRSISACRELNFARAYLKHVSEGAGEELQEALELFVDEKISHAFRSLAYGGSNNARISARRVACYSLVLNENIERCVFEPDKQVASIAAFTGVVLSALLLKQFALLDSFFSAGPFEVGRPLRFPVASGAARLTREFADYEEHLSPLMGPKKDTEWAPTFARGVLKLIILEQLLDQCCKNALPEVREGSLVHAVSRLVHRLKCDLHIGASVPEGATFAMMVDPLRPFMATSRSFEDFNEQALWTRFGGPERILRLVGEIAHSVRYRNRRPFVPTIAVSIPQSSTPPEVTSMRKGPLTAITLYQNSADTLSGVVISNAFPNHMVLASLEHGIREVNIKSSLKFRNRTADGRGLTDAERSTWADVYNRFAAEEKADSDEGWELFLSASATGMRHRHLNAVALGTANSLNAAFGGPVSLSSLSGVSTGEALASSRSEKTNRAGSFLSHGNNRLWTALASHSRPQRTGGNGSTTGSSRDEPITRITAHPFLPSMVSGSSDGSATLWRLGEPKPVCRFMRSSAFSNKSPLTRVRVSPDGFKVLGSDAYGRCSIWQIDLSDSQPFLSLACAAANRPVMDSAFLNLSSVFATCSLDGVVSLFDTLLPPRSSCVATWYNPVAPSSGIPVGTAPNGLCSLAFSPQTRKLFTGTERGSVYAIDVRQCRTAFEARHVHQKQVTSLAISQDGYILGSGSADGSIKLWALDDLTPVASVPNVHPVSQTAPSSLYQGITEIAFAPNGSLFSCGGDGTVKISYSSEAVI